MAMLHEEITDKILNAFFTVYKDLGYGFSEKVYENSMIIEMNELGLTCEQQKPINVYYKNQMVGEYFADIIVNEKVIVELKAGSVLMSQHEAQLLNYLKATKLEVGLLVNFGETGTFKRKLFTNDRKQTTSGFIPNPVYNPHTGEYQ